MSNEKLPAVILTIRRCRPPVNVYHTHRINLPDDGSRPSVFSILERAMDDMGIAELEIGIDDSGLRTVQRIDNLEASKHFAWKPRLNNKFLAGEETERELKPGDTVLWEYAKLDTTLAVS